MVRFYLSVSLRGRLSAPS